MAQRAFESIRFQNQAERLLSEEPCSLCGSSPMMEKVRDDLRKVASHHEITVLLQGESGTGKEVAARMIHYDSNCRGDFVAINCSAIPESLLEAELFGYTKGAYTGAGSDKQGLIEIADKGTLFLDEIGDMPLPLQSKLLRFLDQRNFRPLGGTKEKKVSLKLICATSLDLEKKVKDETFRKDLYFRISVIPIKLPPLRERGRDVLELVSLFLAEFSKRMGKTVDLMTDDVKEVFLAHPWPGNVRELRNIIERILILKDSSDHTIRLADLPYEFLDVPQIHQGIDQPLPVSECAHLETYMDRVEKEFIGASLARCGGNRTQAAAELGISRFSLLRRMQRHGLD